MDSRRFPTMKLAIAILAIGIVAFSLLAPFARNVAWVGERPLDVSVQLFEAESGAAIPNASLTLFRGPRTPWENHRYVRNVDPGDLSDSIVLQTGEDGRAEFSQRFHAAGNDRLFTQTGYIRPHGWWLRVAAPGYSTIFVPLDGQSLRPRQLDDTSPIFVTLGLTKDK